MEFVGADPSGVSSEMEELVFLREAMTCNTTHRPLKENRKTTHVNAKQTPVIGVWGPGREKTSFWMQFTCITQQIQVKPSLTGTSPSFAHRMILPYQEQNSTV